VGRKRWCFKVDLALNDLAMTMALQ
jgi:hypothetical protein